MTTEVVKVAAGHDNEAGLAAFSVEPLVARLVPGIRRISISGKVTEDGYKSCELRWLPEVPDSLNQSIRTSLGLTSAVGAEITIRLPSNANRTTWRNYNGYVTMPDEAEYQVKSWRGLIATVMFLEILPVVP